MNIAIAIASKNYVTRFKNIQASFKYAPLVASIQLRYTTTVDSVESVTTSFAKEKSELQNVKNFNLQDHINNSIDCLNSSDIRAISEMMTEELETLILITYSNNDHKKIENFIKYCESCKILINKSLIYKLFKGYSLVGNVNMVVLLQNYCLKLSPKLYVWNGQYQHFKAKAQCMKGNTQQGLSLLKECYEKNENLRSLYRHIFRELISDSVHNKSEASLVIFEKFVLEFSEVWQEHYPLLCFWHVCWVSNWFSDQELAIKLLDLSESLRNIIEQRASAISIIFLRNDCNEDAVYRLLQALIKYDMMRGYVKVLEILFAHKLRNQDIRGCIEIIHNCKVLGLSLPSDQQGKYIRMIINKDDQRLNEIKSSFKNFKF